jgi:zinc protease
MEIESLGAGAEARTSRDWAHFYTVVARRYIDKGLDVLSDVVMHPRFAQADIDQEREVILDEIARGQNDPMKVLKDSVFGAAYTAHPYRLQVEGTTESVRKITREAIVDYYGKLYVPANTTVVLVGDITAADGVAAVRKAFAGFKSKPLPAAATPKEPARTQAVRKTIKSSTRLAYLAVAFPAPSVKDKPDVYAMDVLTSYLGVGYQSWLATELRANQKLALETSSDFLTQKDPGLAILTISTEPANLAKAEAAIFTKIAELRTKPIGDSDLSRAKRQLEGGNAFDVETFTGRATNLGFYDAVDSIDFAQNYVKNIRSVTADDVLALAKKYLDPNQAVVVVLSP